MSYRLKSIADGAYLFYPMDESSGSTLTNVSYGAINGTYSAPVFNRPPIAHRSFRSIGLTSGSYTIPITNILRAGFENISFTVELWLRANVTPAGTTGIFANSTQGLFVTPSSIEFRAATSNGLISAVYRVPTWEQNYKVAISYTEQALNLYVNDALASSISLEDIAFTGAPTTWGNTGAANIDIEGIGVYMPSISEQRLESHYNFGNEYNLLEDIFGRDDGETFILSDRLATLVINESWPQNGAWPGLFTDTVVDNDGAITTTLEADGLDLDGTWKYAVPLDEFPVVDGSKLDWQGYGVTFEVSLDGEDTWQACTNHQTIPGVIPGMDPVGKTMLLRATLNDSATTVSLPKLFSVDIVIYSSRSQKGWDSTRFATIAGDVDLQRGMLHPAHRSGNFGATLRNGSIVIESDLDNPVPMYTVEAWIRRDSAAAGQILDARAVGQTGRGQLGWSGSAISTTGWLRTYINGANTAASAANMVQGSWVHFIGVLSATTTDPIYFNRIYNGTSYGSNSIAYVTLHTGQLTDAQAANRYAAFTGGARLRIDDSVDLTVDEYPTEPLLLYSDAWSYTGAG